MSWFRLSFERAGDLYRHLFADWLHVDFFIRTAILLLISWLVIFVSALLFKYVLGPLLVLLYVNLFKRAWNFLYTETVYEWIYINYYSIGDSRFQNWYYRLSDRVKRNRAALSQGGYVGILKRGRVRKVGNYMMVAVGIICTLWILAFALNQEYVTPVWAGENTVADEPEESDPIPDSEPENNDTNDLTVSGAYIPGLIEPEQLPEDAAVLFVLEGSVRVSGARLRSGPGTDSTVIEMLWGYDLMTYLGYFVPDSDVEALYWLRVRTPSGNEGYIANQLLEVVE